MAIVRPFQAIRPEKKYAEKVIALPYDVMNREEAAKMAEGNPYSFLHISRSEIDLPEEKNPYSQKVYEKARKNLYDNLQNGIFLQDEEPSLYIYREKMDGKYQTGIVGCVSVDDYEENVIKKHELTRVEKEIDRINHFNVCNANTEPVFLTYKNNMKLKTLIEGYASSNEPEYDITSEDGIEHILWRISDEALINSICQIFDGIEALYIADGHHRSASACKACEKRRANHIDYSGDEEFNYFMAVIFPDKDLRIYDYNRVVKDLNGLSEKEFLAKVKAAGFIINKIDKENRRPAAKHEFTMYLNEQWYKLKCEKRIIPADLIESFDVSILQNNLLHPILGINDPRTDKRIDFVGGIRGLDELERRANSDMKIAFSVYAVTIDELIDVADNNCVMPPKSTWFEPKLGSGLFVHKL